MKKLLMPLFFLGTLSATNIGCITPAQIESSEVVAVKDCNRIIVDNEDKRKSCHLGVVTAKYYLDESLKNSNGNLTDKDVDAFIQKSFHICDLHSSGNNELYKSCLAGIDLYISAIQRVVKKSP